MLANQDQPPPRQYPGVTISSTFEDLEEHRAALMDILTSRHLHTIAMEHDSAKPGVDVIDSSLQKVRYGAAYIGIISRRYGQVPACPRRNPENRSITELEFDEAQRLGRPILLFLMGDAHPVREVDVELDPENRKKLQAFRERAKPMRPDSQVHRVYDTFNSLEQFRAKAARAVAELEDYLQAQAAAALTVLPTASATANTEAAPRPAPIPSPPALYAEPPYIGSHQFVGRQAELDRLSNWAAAADQHPVLLFEAIGGTGKSMLTWEWTNNHAVFIRGDWAGRFWYSFYEKGAIMADFCRRALAYITGRPLEEFRKQNTSELSELLLHHLQARPWLMVLDGLERVLVAYHRYDAPQLADEDAGTSDQIARRDPCDAIRPDDDEVLRMLAGAAPSKMLLTSRLTPRVLLNQSGRAIPGVLRIPLCGLRPPDAEALLRSCGITGRSGTIRQYLQSHCECHPLVTGVLAGLINDYLPDRGNFDAWALDPAAGGRLNLANLALVQKRNHILNTAIAALSEKSREFLSMLALLSEAVDYATLSAFNPHLPPVSEEVPPAPTEPPPGRSYMSPAEQAEVQELYSSQRERWQEYTESMRARAHAAKSPEALRTLTQTVRDLESRGLLQYDQHAKRYDLHPVVRGIAAGGLGPDEQSRYGQRVVDHFSQQTHPSYAEVESLEDLEYELQVVRTLYRIGRRERAYQHLKGDLLTALTFNLEAYPEVLSLLRPLLSRGWGYLPDDLPTDMGARVAQEAGVALYYMGMLDEALQSYGAALLTFLQSGSWFRVAVNLCNISSVLGDQNRLARKDFCLGAAVNTAQIVEMDQIVFTVRLRRFSQLAEIGSWDAAEELWQLLNPMGRNWPRKLYRSGDAETIYALYHFWRGDLGESHLVTAEREAIAGRNRRAKRILHRLRGTWRLEQREWSDAAESLHEAVRMAREVGRIDVAAEAELALAKFHLGQLSNPQAEAERLTLRSIRPHRAIAELWLAAGDVRQAESHAVMAYEHAWADGEPYVYRYELAKARDLLEQLGVRLPNLPPYNPVRDEKLPWEEELIIALEELRAVKISLGRSQG